MSIPQMQKQNRNNIKDSIFATLNSILLIMAECKTSNGYNNNLLLTIAILNQIVESKDNDDTSLISLDGVLLSFKKDFHDKKLENLDDRITRLQKITEMLLSNNFSEEHSKNEKITDEKKIRPNLTLQDIENLFNYYIENPQFNDNKDFAGIVIYDLSKLSFNNVLPTTTALYLSKKLLQHNDYSEQAQKIQKSTIRKNLIFVKDGKHLTAISILAEIKSGLRRKEVKIYHNYKNGIPEKLSQYLNKFSYLGPKVEKVGPENSNCRVEETEHHIINKAFHSAFIFNEQSSDIVKNHQEYLNSKQEPSRTIKKLSNIK